MRKALTTTVLLAAAFMGSANAGVIDNTVITDLTDQSNNPSFQVDRPLGVTLTGDEAVYLVGTLNAQATFTGTANWYEAGLIKTNDIRTTSVGLVGSADLGILRNGGAKITAATDLAQDTPTSFVLKVNLVTGDQWLWIDPNLGAAEDTGAADAMADNAHSDGAPGDSALAGASIDSVFFRSGTWAGNTNTYDFTDFAVYFGGDSPFVPEPSSLALLGLGGLALARRRRA